MLRDRLLPLVSGCRREEAPLVGRLWALAFCLGLSVALFRNSSQGEFVVRFGIGALPVAFLASAALAGLLVAAFGRLQARVSRLTICTALLGVFLAVMVLTRLAAFVGLDELAVAVNGYVAEVVYLVGALGFWPVAISLLDIRQGKRVFGFLGTAEALAEMFAGLLGSAVIPWLGVEPLLNVSVLMLVVALVLARETLRSHPGNVPSPLSAGQLARGPAGLTRNPYLLLILAGYGLAIVSSYLLEYLFRAGLKRTSGSDAGEVATWLGLFYAVANGLSLFTQIVIAPRLLERTGVRRVLPLLPLAVIFGVAMALVCRFTWGFDAAVAAIVCTKLAERVLTRGIQVPTVRVMYQAVPASQRLGFQAAVEATGNVAVALVSVGLLLLREYIGTEPRTVLLTLIPVLLAWVWLSLALGRAYRVQLQLRLRLKRPQFGEAGFEMDAEARKVLTKWLRRPNPEEVVQALRLLASFPPDPELAEACAALLGHPTTAVRREAVLRLAASGDSQWGAKVRPLIRGDPAMEVRAVAVHALAELSPLEALELLLELADGPDEVLAHAALAGLLRHGGLEGVLAAGPRLMAWAGAHDPGQRAAGATVLGEAGVPAFYRPLLALLRDPEVAVQRAALHASGEVRHPALWPAVCEQLARPDLRLTAVRALLRGGPAALPAVAAAAGREAAGVAERLLLVRLAWRLGDRASVPVLLRWADSPDLRVRVEALDALVRLGYVPPAAEQQIQRERVRGELRRATELVAAAEELAAGHGEPDQLLTQALRLEWRRRAEAVLARLDLQEPSPGLRDVRQWLREGRGERGLALEALELSLPREFAPALVTLLDEMPERERRQRLEAWDTPGTVRLCDRLRRLWEGGEMSAWTRACLLWKAGQAGLGELSDLVQRALKDADPLVRDGSLGGAPADEREGPVIPTAVEREEPEIPTVERVLLLKQVDMFAAVDDDVLAGLAKWMRERKGVPGEALLREGEVGQELYVVVEGRVRVHRGEKILAELERGGVVGELAALDPAPRMATVTALKPTTLLCLEHADLAEELLSNSDLAWGIIRFLVRRFRDPTR